MLAAARAKATAGTDGPHACSWSTRRTVPSLQHGEPSKRTGVPSGFRLQFDKKGWRHDTFRPERPHTGVFGQVGPPAGTVRRRTEPTAEIRSPCAGNYTFSN
jgi:hypothetical protein